MCSQIFGILLTARRSAISKALVNTSGVGVRMTGAVAIMLGILQLGLSAAHAQNCIVPATKPIMNLGVIGSSPASVSSMISSVVTTANTAFILRNVPFVSGNGASPTDQQSGGVWFSGLAGNVTAKSGTIATVTAPLVGETATITCSQKIVENFAGVQLGSDIAKLKVSGWDFHVGSTVGYLESRGGLSGGAFSIVDPASGLLVGGGPFDNDTQIPFAGAYAAALNGPFFIGALLRAEYYQASLTAPDVNLFGQSLDAHGYTFSGSTSYTWRLPDSKWFIEPSAEIIVARTKVDPFNYVTNGTAIPGVIDTKFIGTLQLQDIDSEIGHLGLKIGTSIDAGKVIVVPFGAVSVWHEFGPNITSNFALAPSGVSLSVVSSTSTFGTFAQYSLGASAILPGTGWIGYVTLDYRDGPNLQGLSGTGGIRYQFTPDMAPKVTIPVKAPVRRAPVSTAINWTGLYIGGFGAANLGHADWDYISGEANPHIGGYVWGADVGYNYQVDRWVLGLEADLAKTNTHGGTGCNPFAPLASPFLNATCSAWTNWTATVTGRVGYTWDRALLYVRGGGAWTTEQFAATCNTGSPNACIASPGVGFTGITAAASHLGWVIGYGAEFALTRNWSAKAEYDYLNFGDRTVIALESNHLHTPLDLGMHIPEVKIGVNYRFNVGSIAAN